MQANGSNFNAPGLQQSSVAQAKAQEAVALAQAEQIRVSISKATIVSPINGVVVNRNLNPGEYPGTRQIFTLQQVSPIYAILRGSTDQIAGIRSGATATIQTDGVSGKQEIQRLGNRRAQRDSTRFDAVPGEGALANPGEVLRPGMAVSGSVALPAARGVMVPTTAFTDDNHDAVQIVQTDNTVKTVA